MDRAPSTAALRARLSRAGVLTDFDGTLAPIVEDPSTVVPAPGAVEVLTELAARAALVGVVSGRPLDLLARHLPDARLHLAGLYGLERRRPGGPVDRSRSERWRAPVAAAADELGRRVPDGVLVEDKGSSLTVHFRVRPQHEVTVRALAQEVAAGHGLTVRPARRSVEVHPAHAPDKGSVVGELAAGCEAACFVGDDVGDISAFDALDRLAADGLVTVKVAVASAEAPSDLLDGADVVVDGALGAVRWLRSLL